LTRRLFCHFRLLTDRFEWSKGWLAVTRAIVLWIILLSITIAVPILGYSRGLGWMQSVYGALAGPQTKSSPQPTLFPAEPSSAPQLGWAVKTGGILGYIVLLGGIFWRLRRIVKNPLEVNLRHYLRAPDYRSRVSFIEQFHEDFARLVKAYARGNKLLVFIDDVDRCEVPKAADLMQALNLLVASEAPLIFVIGMDREKVAAGLAAKYERLLPYLSAAYGTQSSSAKAVDVLGGLEFGYAFIEKFIQIPFRVPRPGQSDVKRFLETLGNDSVLSKREERLAPSTDTPPRTREAAIANDSNATPSDKTRGATVGSTQSSGLPSD